jgi:hypothetical protein
MTSHEAVELLKQGGRVSREIWHGAVFLAIEPARTFTIGEQHPASGLLPSVTYRPRLMRFDHLGFAEPYGLTAEDIATDDWSAVTN